MLQRIRLGALLLVVAISSVAPAATAAEPPPSPVLSPTDFSAPIVDPPDGLQAVAAQGVFDNDPLGLIPKLPFVQRYSLDRDHWEVWLCGDTGYTLGGAIADLEAAATEYFDAMSLGRYEISFSAGGTLPGDPHCLNGFENDTYSTVGSAEGIFIIDSVTGGGYASPGIICSGGSNCDWIPTTFPGNGRYAVLGAGALANYPSVAVHEMGHTLQWPHSNSGRSEYDNPIDLMSGNSTTNGYTEPKPYGSLAFNRYQSGWIDAADVTIASSIYREVLLQPYDADGQQMIAVKTATAGVFYTLGARTSSTHDPIPTDWEGVEVYLVDHNCGRFGSEPCPGIFREQRQEPPNPEGVAHVLQPGESIVLEGIEISVTARTGSGYTVAIGDPANSLPFTDIANSAFIDEIIWLSDQSITKGCNPPANSRFCPTDPVTRGEMAAFLVRVLNLSGPDTAPFTDAVGSIFEADIAKLAAAGITKGCNPPANSNYCPNRVVTRGEMAAFLVRAFDLETGSGNTFTDDDESVFEVDIARLATAGVTKGCNPPANTRFCPDSPVTREQMAAFLSRAVSG
ncbi:MAG: hypothetical protein GY788_01905 [bacterium]|nr:hypothetical protein [bacterium]